MTSPARDELAALARKYRTLHELRARREAAEAAGHTSFAGEEAAARRAAFRRLAREFPGALRELEVSTAADLARKAAAVEAELAARAAAPEGAPRRRWMVVVADYHALLRDVLAVKGWLAARRVRAVDPPLLEAFRAWYTRAAPRRRAIEEADAAFLQRHIRPPGGRLQNLVWELLEARHGVDAAAARRLIFGPPVE